MSKKYSPLSDQGVANPPSGKMGPFDGGTEVKGGGPVAGDKFVWVSGDTIAWGLNGFLMAFIISALATNMVQLASLKLIPAKIQYGFVGCIALIAFTVTLINYYARRRRLNAMQTNKSIKEQKVHSLAALRMMLLYTGSVTIRMFAWFIGLVALREFSNKDIEGWATIEGVGTSEDFQTSIQQYAPLHIELITELSLIGLMVLVWSLYTSYNQKWVVTIGMSMVSMRMIYQTQPGEHNEFTAVINSVSSRVFRWCYRVSTVAPYLLVFFGMFNYSLSTAPVEWSGAWTSCIVLATSLLCGGLIWITEDDIHRSKNFMESIAKTEGQRTPNKNDEKLESQSKLEMRIFMRFMSLLFVAAAIVISIFVIANPETNIDVVNDPTGAVTAVTNSSAPSNRTKVLSWILMIESIIYVVVGFAAAGLAVAAGYIYMKQKPKFWSTIVTAESVLPSVLNAVAQMAGIGLVCLYMFYLQMVFFYDWGWPTDSLPSLNTNILYFINFISHNGILGMSVMTACIFMAYDVVGATYIEDAKGINNVQPTAQQSVGEVEEMVSLVNQASKGVTV